MNPKNVVSTTKWLMFLLSAALFIASLTQCAYCTEADGKGECTRAISALLTGWLGILTGSGASVSWFANLLLVASWILLFNAPRFIIYTSAFALLLMLRFLLIDQILIDEAGNYSKIVNYGLGYWLWLLSDVVLLVGIAFLMIGRNWRDIIAA